MANNAPTEEEIKLAMELRLHVREAALTAIRMNLLIVEEGGLSGFPPTAVIGTVVDMTVDVVREFGEQIDKLDEEQSDEDTN